MMVFAVSSELRDWGVGRVVSLTDSDATAELEFFVSPADSRRYEVVSVDSLAPVELEQNSRVYVFDEETGSYLPGRLVESGEVDPTTLDPDQFPNLPAAGSVYVVAFPRGVERAVLPSHVYPRWGKEVSSPLPWLASRTHEGPFLYCTRREVVREILRQRSLFSGMTSLASSSVELFEHQFSAVKTVLQDPVMRYVLADEVGLGKTIEAGIIVRQHILDEPSAANVLILAPSHLVGQWETELAGLFGLSRRLGKTVHVLPYDAGDLTEVLSERRTSMLVIDEAHQVADLARGASKAGRAQYEALADVAHRAEHVLLLSATPVIRNEEGFLAMLHLLDPRLYHQEDVVAFQERLAESEKFGSIVAFLRPGQNAALLRRALNALTSLPRDELTSQLAAKLETLVGGDRGSADRDQAIAALRLHIQEVYRVHRRLVRTSREDPRADDYLPLGREVKAKIYANRLRDMANSYLEDWRFAVLEKCLKDRIDQARQLFAEWVDAVLVHPWELQEEFARRLEAIRSGSEAAFFSEEAEVLSAALSKLDAEDAEHSKALVDDVCQRVLGIGKKAVVFGSSQRVSKHLHDALRQRLGDRVARVSSGNAEVAERFARDPGLSVLIIDRDGEQGLNLQLAGPVIVHADLPMSPMRVEQRMGRVDRLQSKAARVVASVPLSGGGYEQAVFEFLQATGVFQRSVAPLQYLLAEVLRDVRERLLDEGAEALLGACRQMKDPEHRFSLEKETERAMRLRILDEMARDEDDSRAYEVLEEYEYGEGAQEFAEAVRTWLGRGCLGLRRLGETEREQYAYSRGSSLFPRRAFLQFFRTALQTGARGQATGPVAFDRSEATKLRIPLARVGCSLIDGVERQARQDERGLACAIWRKCSEQKTLSSNPVFLRFDYLVEAAVVEGNPAIRRLADSIFPPRLETVWINLQFVEEKDEELLKLLAIEIKSGGLGTVDYTLRAGPTWSAADRALDGRWAHICSAAMEAADAVIRERVSVSEAVSKAKRAVIARLAATEAIFRARSIRMGDGSASYDVSEQLCREGETAAYLESAVTSPRIDLQFAGAIFLSSEGLPVAEESE